MGGAPAGGEPMGGEPAGGEPAGGEPAGGEPAGGEPVGGGVGTFAENIDELFVGYDEVQAAYCALCDDTPECLELEPPLPTDFVTCVEGRLTEADFIELQDTVDCVTAEREALVTCLQGLTVCEDIETACPGLYESSECVGVEVINQQINSAFYSSCFICDDGSSTAVNLCDGVSDCTDGSDEAYCDLLYQCADGSQYVDQYYTCDGQSDCPDGSDETDPTLMCPAPFSCADGSGDVPAQSVCDLVPNCPDASDETTTCGEVFSCDNGQLYIPVDWTCDSFADCADGSDESDPSLMCPQPYLCSNGETIPSSWTCDGFEDCEDGLDESDPALMCPEPFTCPNGDVIPPSWVCDDLDDCGDNADEMNCP